MQSLLPHPCKPATFSNSLLLVVEHWGIRTITHSQNFSEDLRINLTNGRCCQLILKFAQILLQILLLVSLKWKCSDVGEGLGLIWIFTFTFTIVPAVAVPFTFPISADTFEVKREREGSGLIWPLYLGAHWHLTPRSSPQRLLDFHQFCSRLKSSAEIQESINRDFRATGDVQHISNSRPLLDLLIMPNYVLLLVGEICLSSESCNTTSSVTPRSQKGKFLAFAKA